jgi:hypothetical protein
MSKKVRLKKLIEVALRIRIIQKYRNPTFLIGETESKSL